VQVVSQRLLKHIALRLPILLGNGDEFLGLGATNYREGESLCFRRISRRPELNCEQSDTTITPMLPILCP
jgi:hypothetical protein